MLWKNYLLVKKYPKDLLRELGIPIIFLLALVLIKLSVHNTSMQPTRRPILVSLAHTRATPHSCTVGERCTRQACTGPSCSHWRQPALLCTMCISKHV